MTNYFIATRPAAQNLIGVVGAGTMGAGIAQVAAQAGHPVRLLDVREGAASAAIEQIGKGLAGLVSKGRMQEAERSAILARIQPASSTAELADAALVVEVILEKLEPKQALLRELDTLLAPEALVASNTSSISITALANGMENPHRLVGMHFFNPVPLMKLVEVVSGAETNASVAAATFALAQSWGKTAVHAKSTPGFIVNRIARPFYAETLALLQEQSASPAMLDAALRSAGFRMGPCELMDLIGQDINYSVTQSMFEANFGDKRFVPSQVQKALVDGGRLGRKVGKGFYDGASPANPAPALGAKTPAVELHGSSTLLAHLRTGLASKGVAFASKVDANWCGLLIGDLRVHLCDGRSAGQIAAQTAQAQTAVLDWVVAPDHASAVACSFAPSVSSSAKAQMAAFAAACGWTLLELRDLPGLPVARTLAMLINEAADAVSQGVCDESAANLAMKLGVNYPAGPFEWLALIGAQANVELLDNLWASTRSERYRVSQLLQAKRWSI